MPFSESVIWWHLQCHHVILQCKKTHRKPKNLIELGEKCLFMLPCANTVVQMCFLTVIVVKEYIDMSIIYSK